MKTLFEQLGGTYVQDGDYLIPNLSIPDSRPIGKYGMLCKSHLENSYYTRCQPQRSAQVVKNTSRLFSWRPRKQYN